jgi:hypothetical protein
MGEKFTEFFEMGGATSAEEGAGSTDYFLSFQAADCGRIDC